MGNYIPLQNINSIIEKRAKTHSVNSIIRKRETTIHLLKYKLSLLLNTCFDDIIIEQKNKNDKRIKEIKLNTQHFKIIDF